MPGGRRSRVFIRFAVGSRRAVRGIAVAMSVILAASLVSTLDKPAAATAAAPKLAPACPGERDDEVSASVTARLCGKPVEVLSRRTERTQVWARPEGGFSSQVHGGPVRYRDGEVWKPVDLTLRRQPDGSVAPVGHPRGLRLSGTAGAGEHALATVAVGDDALSMAFTGALPEPELSGHEATYREVYPGVDLVLAATRTGF